MQPTIEIIRTQNGRFSFAVEIGDGGEWYVRDGLVSIAACVKNAAAALGREFKFATIAYNRMPVASEPMARVLPRSLLAADPRVALDSR